MSSISDFEAAEAALWQSEATGRMNRMYRWQRYIYDVTRRYYLLGRDEMIDRIQPTAGAIVLEVGCGTGRNLVQAARKYPAAHFYGIDVSTEMLTTAIAASERHHLNDRIRVAHGDATSFDPAALFGVAAFDHVMISYSLSMIPDWHAVLLRWLALFEVTPRRSLQSALEALAAKAGARLTFERPYRGYAQSAVLTLPNRPD
jgi:S-adenosylmethionine-diacylgycerolhomoserine-N-methlytransferase